MKNSSPPPNVIAATTFAAFLLLLFIPLSCKKADPLNTTGSAIQIKQEYQKGDFVFSLANLRKITRPRSVSGTGEIAATHLYVRFKPVTQQHYDAIEQKNIPVYPYPLATDSLDVSNPDYSTLYTFLPIYKLLPNCPYEILDSVRLMNPESELAMMAYKAAGKETLFTPDGYDIPQEPVCDPWEDCPPEEDPPPPPPPVLNPADPRPVPATVSFNSCSMNTDDNYPSGRITVEETQWGAGAVEGVADVKIEVLGPNGQRVVTQTNRYGCFKASGAIRGFKLPFNGRLPVILNVIFKSNRKEIRGVNRIVPDQYTKPLLHIWGDISRRMNNADVHYNRQTGTDDEGTKQYVAATVNNALYEYDEYAAQDEILSPPNGILILVHCFASAAATPMLNDLKDRDVWDASVAGNYLNTRAGGLGGLLLPSAPDMLYGYDWNNRDNNHPNRDYATDKIKETAYHEFAHASHYRITTPRMWIDNIKYIVDYGADIWGNPYGNVGNPGVERTDLIEMWGYFLGREYAHRRYGPTRHSLSTTPTFLNSWYAENEITIFDWHHIPTGILHDLLDNNTYNSAQTPSLVENNIIQDTIVGYRINTFFNFLDGSTNSPSILLDKLRNILPNNIEGNTHSRFDSLRVSYRY